MKLDFNAAKEQVAKDNGYPSWSSVVQNLVGDAYITTIERQRRDRKEFLRLEQAAAELLAQSWANEAVKEDRSETTNHAYYDPDRDEHVVSCKSFNKPLPYPEQL